MRANTSTCKEKAKSHLWENRKLKTAVIDVGSNSVRYACFSESPQVTQKELDTTVLADGLFFSGKLSDSAMERTLDAIARFCNKAKNANADKIFIFATEAVRAASNGKIFADKVFERCGLPLDVIDGDTEAKIGFLGACPNPEITVAVFDIGGASSEIICGRGGEIIFEKSSPTGCVRLLDGAGGNRGKAEKIISDTLPRSLPKAEKIIGIGGTATALGAMAHCPENYNPNITHGSTVAKNFLERTIADFFGGKDLKKEYPSLSEKRAKIIGYGALTAIYILNTFDVNEFTVSETDNMEGYLFLKSNSEKIFA